MEYQSTRGGESGVSPSLAIVKGLAKDGGLFVPDSVLASSVLKGAFGAELSGFSL